MAITIIVSFFMFYRITTTINLPRNDQILSIEITLHNQDVVVINDAGQVSALMTTIGSARQTRRLNGMRHHVNTIQRWELHAHYNNILQRFFVLEDEGRFFLWIEYEGIYRLSQRNNDVFQNFINSSVFY